MNRILVTGGSGQLGQCFQNLTSNRPEWIFFFPSKEEVNICEIGTVEFYVQKHQINTIINTAAYTQVDQAEKEKSQAYAVNKQAIENLLFVGKKNKMKIDIITENKLTIREYIVDIKNKSKKTIELIEHFEKLKNLELQKKESNVIDLKVKKKLDKFQALGLCNFDDDLLFVQFKL